MVLAYVYLAVSVYHEVQRRWLCLLRLFILDCRDLLFSTNAIFVAHGFELGGVFYDTSMRAWHYGRRPLHPSMQSSVTDLRFVVSQVDGHYSRQFSSKCIKQ